MASLSQRAHVTALPVAGMHSIQTESTALFQRRPVRFDGLHAVQVLLDAAGHPRVADMGLARRLTPARSACRTVPHPTVT